VADLYNKETDWDRVRSAVMAINLFQARTESTLKKLYREVSSRLQTLTKEELGLFAGVIERDQKQLTWLAICRRHKLIADFAIEVLSNNYNRSQYSLSHDDYDAFYHQKAEWHSNLDAASSSTQSKARQVLFKMLRECGLINEQDELVVQRLSPQLLYLLKEKQSVDLSIFPGVDI
jgi:hypothetical protein